MRGNLRDLVPIPDVRGKIADNRLAKFIRGGKFKMLSVLGLVLVLMALSSAGILSALGVFIISMVKLEVLSVVISSLVLTASVSIFLACYIWLTG